MGVLLYIKFSYLLVTSQKYYDNFTYCCVHDQQCSSDPCVQVLQLEYHNLLHLYYPHHQLSVATLKCIFWDRHQHLLGSLLGSWTVWVHKDLTLDLILPNFHWRDHSWVRLVSHWHIWCQVTVELWKKFIIKMKVQNSYSRLQCWY